MSTWRNQIDLEKPKKEDDAMKQMARSLLSGNMESDFVRPAHLTHPAGEKEVSKGIQELIQEDIQEEESNTVSTQGIRPISIPGLEKEQTIPLQKEEEPPAESEVNAVKREVEEKTRKRRESPLLNLKKVSIDYAKKRIRSPKLTKELTLPRRTRRFATLHDAVSFSRTQLPLPTEMQINQKQEHYTWLISRINNCQNQAELASFAFSLNFKDLAILFPALATLKKGEEIERLIQIILMRASKYLYVQGWITLQYSYPRSTVQKGLAVLCEVLEENDEDIRKIRLTSDDDFEFDGLNLGHEHFDWRSVHLISEISLPNTRHFLSSIIKYIRDSGISGDDFFQRYGIYRDLSLGQAITSQWEMAIFESSLHSQNPLRRLFSNEE